MNAPNTTELIYKQSFDKLSFAKFLRQLLPRGRGWQIPLEDESEIRLTGITSLEGFGLITLIAGNTNILVNSIPSEEAFGGVDLLAQYMTIGGIPSSESFGSHTISNP